MGTSEIYRAVVALPAVTDAIVVDADGWMPLFIVLSPGVTLDRTLRTLITTHS